MIAFELSHGQVPPGKEVCHTRECATKVCGRPEHLYAGTRAENVRDAQAAGWKPGRSRGEANGSAKLTAAEVLAIRECLRAGLSYRTIAHTFNISEPQISNIRRGASWGWL